MSKLSLHHQPAKRSVRPSIRYLGGASTVTGSRFLLETNTSRVLIDCGMFQGSKPLRLLNWSPFPVDPGEIDAVVVTHAHLDHVGYLPALFRAGFSGPVHATKGTAELAEIVLLDAAHIQMEDALRATRIGSSRHRPARPLFTDDDANDAISRLISHSFNRRIEVTEDVAVHFRRAGHILGSSWIELEIANYGRVAMSGDLGRGNHPILLPPEPLSDVEVLLIESTYGDREHTLEDPSELLAATITRTAERGGSLIIPSFAVDRTEVLLIHLSRLRKAGSIPSLPVFIDSPMALDGLRVYKKAIAERWSDVQPEMFDHHDPFDTAHIQEVRTVDESKALNNIRYPSIIIAGSGMATGGRVLHHLEQRLPHPANTVVLVGYQVEGTRGRQLADGAKQLKMFGEYVDVRAEMVNLPGFSVHADLTELLQWASTPTRRPRTTHVVHGEAEASANLAKELVQRFKKQAIVPHHDEIIVLPRQRS